MESGMIKVLCNEMSYSYIRIKLIYAVSNTLNLGKLVDETHR